MFVYLCDMIDYDKKIEELSWHCKAYTRGMLSLSIYAEVESQHDPNFFRWLFDDYSIPDFTLPQDRALEYHQFLIALIEYRNAR